jgi:integration host factor subunit alpha
MTLTKADIIENLATKGFTKKRAAELFESILEIMKARLGQGEDLLVSGFGKFCLRKKAERIGRNPKTGVEALVSERKVVTFRCSGKLRSKINGG